MRLQNCVYDGTGLYSTYDRESTVIGIENVNALPAILRISAVLLIIMLKLNKGATLTKLVPVNEVPLARGPTNPNNVAALFVELPNNVNAPAFAIVINPVTEL